VPGLEGAGGAAQPAGAARRDEAADGHARAAAAAPAADEQRGQLHCEPGQRRALARREGRGAGRGRLPGDCGVRGALRRRRQRARHCDQRRGARQGLPAQGDVYARHGAARARDAVCRGLPRLADQGPDPPAGAARGRAVPDVRAGHQGGVGGGPGQAPPGLGDAHDGVPARLQDIWRRVHLPHGGQQGVARAGGRPGLCEPVPVAVQGVPALQDAPAGGGAARGRARAVVRRAGAGRGRAAVAAAAVLPGRRADRRHGGAGQCAQDQGHPQRHEERHPGRGLRAPGRDCRQSRRRARGARGLRGGLPGQQHLQGAARGAQRAAVVPLAAGHVGRHAVERAGHAGAQGPRAVH
ncbi:hypothetical protein H4R21_006898, partial [Coemansia helicoidea]